MKDTATALPFGCEARTIESVMPVAEISDSGDTPIFATPWALGGQGTGGRFVHLNWPVPVKGSVRYRVRMDDTSL